MKKIIGLVLAFVVLCGNVLGQSLSKSFSDTMKSFDSLTGAKSQAIAGNLPNGRNILPAVWDYTHQEFKSENKKFISATAKITKINVMDNEYQIKYEYFTKGGFGNQGTVMIINVSADSDKFYVQTVSQRTYSVNKNLEYTGSPIDANANAMNQTSKNFVQAFENMLKGYADEEYNKLNDAACSDFEVQLSVSQQAANKLKAKRWYEAHPLVGKEIEIPFMFTSIKETKKDGYTLELSGLCGLAETVLITVYSNNDKYVDTKDNQVLTIKGIVSDIQYTDSDFDKDYKIKQIYIEEK